jgi:hypothetical protein
MKLGDGFIPSKASGNFPGGMENLAFESPVSRSDFHAGGPDPGVVVIEIRRRFYADPGHKPLQHLIHERRCPANI